MHLFPLSPDLAPKGSLFFGSLKKNLTDKRFATEAYMRQALTCWLQKLDTGFFHARTHALVPRLDERLNINGDYREVWCVSSAINMPCINKVRMES
jgi:hypothetical protein